MYLKKALGSLVIVFGFVLISCGHPMNQTTVGAPKPGSLTTSDKGEPQDSKSDDSASFVAVPVRSTFESDCNAKKGVKIIKNEDGSKTLLLHSFCIKSASATYDQSKKIMSFKGTADFEGFRNLKAYPFDVTGEIAKGRGLLKTTNKNADSSDPKFAAAVFCNDLSGFSDANSDKKIIPTCGSFFIDLYVRIQGFDNERFEEQVEDCAKSDQCLSVQGAPSAPDVVAKKPEVTADTSTQHATQTPDSNPKQVAKPDKKETAIAPAIADPVPVVEAPPPADLEINADNAEQEGSDLTLVPSPYVALNKTSQVNLIFDLDKSEASPDQLDVINGSDNSAAVAPLADAAAPAPVADPKSDKKTKLIPKSIPKVETKPKMPPKVVPPKVDVPAKPDAPVKTDVKAEAPVVKPVEVIKTSIPDPIDPAIAAKEFPLNVPIPIHGPQQVFVLKYPNGYLVNGTELSEPEAGEPPTFVIDSDTKNLKNRNYRKTFGAFYVVDFLKEFAKFSYGIINRPIRFNDLSLQKGGVLPPHTWHQIGLDVDIEYGAPGGKGQEITAEQKWMLFQRIGASPLVNVILLDRKDKVAVCEIANARGDTDYNSRMAMQKLKVEDGHPTHFHVNFSCTFNSRCRQLEDQIQSQYPQNEGECLTLKVLPKQKARSKK